MSLTKQKVTKLRHKALHLLRTIKVEHSTNMEEDFPLLRKPSLQ